VRFRGDELKQVVVLRKAEGVDTRLQAVEFYADGVVLRWLLRGEAEKRASDFDLEEDDFWPQFALRDDVGSSYLPAGGHGGGGFTYRGESVFVPGVPSHASWLEIRGVGDPIRLALSADGVHQLR
jgi:hypothetical protein